MKHYNKVCGEDDGTDRGSPNSMSHTSSSHHLPNSTHHPSNSGSDKENAHKDTLKCQSMVTMVTMVTMIQFSLI